MVDAVKYFSLVIPIFPGSSKKYEVVTKNDAPQVDLVLGVFSNFFFQFRKFFAVDIRMNCFSWQKELIVENSLLIQPNRKHNLLLMKVLLIRSNIWWIRRTPL